jgi:hypothetical protein
MEVEALLQNLRDKIRVINADFRRRGKKTPTPTTGPRETLFRVWGGSVGPEHQGARAVLKAHRSCIAKRYSQNVTRRFANSDPDARPGNFGRRSPKP